MYQENLSRYYISQLKIIKKNFLLSANNFDAEGIHYLRVETRRIKAFFDLVKSINNEFQLKNQFRRLRKLFKGSGEIRDIQVQITVAREIEGKLNVSFDQYHGFLKNKELIFKKRFGDIIGTVDKDVLKPNKKMINNVLGKISENIAIARVKKQSKILLNQLYKCGNTKDVKEDRLHQIRILSKNVRYSIEIVQDCFPEVRDENIALLGLLKEIHQILGKWHDYEVSLELLKSFKAESINVQSMEIKTYNKILKNIKMDKAELASVFEKKWVEFCALRM